MLHGDGIAGGTEMGRRTLALWAGLLLGLWTAAPQAVAKDSADPIVVEDEGEAFEAAADAIEGFWGSVLVARDGEILFAKGYGMADFEERPCTPLTLYELASVSKQVTATAILHLAQRGKLSLDDKLDRFFDDVPEAMQDITVRHLVTHTAGLNDDGVGYADPIATDRYVEQMLSKKRRFDAGTDYRYSNVGYALLGCIVEKVSRGDFEAYCEKHLFKPAKMKNTGFVGDKDLIKSRHVSVRNDGGRIDRTAADWNWGWGYRGMGGVVSTVLDMHRWDRALRDGTILDEEHLALLHRPNLRGYAGGWNLSMTDRGTLRASHSGGVAGYKTNCIRYVEDDVFVVVLGNDGRATFAVSGAIDELLFERVEMEMDLDASGLDDDGRGGVVASAKAKFTAKRKGDTVRLRLVDGRDTPLELRAPTGVARRLHFQLDQGIRDRAQWDDGAKPTIAASLVVGRYEPGAKKAAFTKGVHLVGAEATRRDERGNEIIEPHIRISIYDLERGGRAFLADLNVSAARELRDALAKALE